MAGASAADYAWFTDHWLRQAFCFSLVRGLDEAEVLRRLGAERSQPRRLTLDEAAELSASFHAGYPQLVQAARVGGWSVAIEDNGWEGARPEVLRALSRGTQVVSVYQNVNAHSRFSYAADGVVLVGFEPLFPQRRWGSRPDLLLPLMRAAGLDPGWRQPPYGTVDLAALALAERLTGVHLDAAMLDGPLTAAEVTPLLPDPPASSWLQDQDAELAAVIDRAGPAVLRRAAATAARLAVGLAGLGRDPVVAGALAVAEAGQARRVGDGSPLGWRIRSLAVEAEVVSRVRNDPSAVAGLTAGPREAAPSERAGPGTAAQGPLALAGAAAGRDAAATLGCGPGAARRAVRRPAHRRLRHARTAPLPTGRRVDGNPGCDTCDPAAWPHGHPAGRHRPLSSPPQSCRPCAVRLASSGRQHGVSPGQPSTRARHRAIRLRLRRTR
jgi:hypothetical protein